MVVNQIVKYNATDPISLVFAALADPTRRSILSHLSEHDATVNELAAPFQMSLPAISKHLKVLEHAGLISRTKKAQFRPRHLETKRLEEATRWLDEYKKHWEQSLDNLDTYLHHVQTTNQKEKS